MEIILLGIYAFFAWLVFFKFKWLPWNIITQVITVTLPIMGITAMILILNIVAPSSADVRVVNYVVPINPPVRGLVIEVPIEPNRPIQKGDVLFRIDPTPYEIVVQNFAAQIVQLEAQLVTAEANSQNLQEQLKSTTGQKAAVQSQLALAKLRLDQFRELAESGAGNRFDYERAQSDVANIEGQLASAAAAEAQARESVDAKTLAGEQDQVAVVKAQIASANAQLADAEWQLSQTTYYAPAKRYGGGTYLAPGRNGRALAGGARDEFHRG